MYLDAQFRAEEICPARSAEEHNELDALARGRFRLFHGSELGAALLGLLPADTALVTSVRDPLARAISQWRMVLHNPMHRRHAALVANHSNDSSFEWFLRTMVTSPMTRLLSASDDTSVGGEWDHERFSDAECIDRAIARLESCAVVGLTELQHESIALIAHRFGWAPPETLPNISPAPPSALPYEPTALERELFASRNAADLAVHRRAVELFERRRRLLSNDLRHRLYELRLAGDATDLARRIVIDVGALAPGSGWLPSTKVGGAAVRNIGAGGRATLDLPIRLPRFTKLEVLCTAFGSVDDLDQLAVSVNGEPVTLQARLEPGAATLHGVVPRGTEPCPFTRIEFTAAKRPPATGFEAPLENTDFSVRVSTVTLTVYEPKRLRATTITSMSSNASPALIQPRVLLETSPAWTIDDDLQARLDSLNLWGHAEELQRDGYTVVRDVVPAVTIARVRDLILRHADAAMVKTRSRDHWLPFAFDPLFVELFLHPVQLALADLVCGKGMLSSCAGLVRDARSHPSGLHTENAMYFPAPFPKHNFMLSSMLTCDDFNERAGGTCFVPGSHLRLVDPPDQDSTNLTGSVPADAPAGSLVLWLGGTWHGTYQRELPGERVSLLTIFTRPQLRPVQDLHAIPDQLIVSDDMRLRLRRGDLFDRPGNESPANTLDQLRWVRGHPKNESTISLEWGETLASRRTSRST